MKFSTIVRFPLFAAAMFAAGTVGAQVNATSVSSFTQGMRADGVSPIGVTRSNPNNAVGAITANHDANIGEASNNSSSVEFVSLGFGGEIVLEFASPICNQAGSDLTVYETSYGSPSCAAWPEKALVYARQDECQPWILISSADGICQNADLDLGVLSWAKYVKIEDITNPTLNVFFSSNQDGFDVDGVVGYSSCGGAAVSPADKYSPNAVVSAAQGLRKNGTAVPANRSIQGRMLGAPQMSDASTPASNYPFYAMGYHGTVTLSFPYTILNVAGADLQVFETTFGDNPSRTCASYPEKAKFEGSIDGSTWFDLDAVVTADDAGAILCRDGKLNIPAAQAGLNYIRVTDVTVLFGAGSTDAYDIDGIVGLGQCGSNTNPGAGKLATEEEIGEGEFGIEVYPNPASDVASLNVNGLNNTDNYTIKVIDMMGRVVSTEAVNNSTGSFTHNLSINKLTAGVYMITVESNGMREVTKLIKK
ncbi:MAG: hypothetical protein RLZZ543_1913 [Bacteroidota bacterium]|jgi:hypothetical protein